MPWERTDSRGRGRYTAPRTRDWQTLVQVAARRAGLRVPLAGPLRVELRFWRATSRRCDVDNLAKSVLDALNGLAYGDDTQVVELLVRKGVDREKPRAEVLLATDVFDHLALERLRVETLRDTIAALRAELARLRPMTEIP